MADDGEEEPEEPQSGVGAFEFGGCGKYEGEWARASDGRKVRSGRGSYRSSVGVYEGAWSDDAMSGAGSFAFASGARYAVSARARTARPAPA